MKSKSRSKSKSNSKFKSISNSRSKRKSNSRSKSRKKSRSNKMKSRSKSRSKSRRKRKNMANVKLSSKLYYGIHPSVVEPDFQVDHYIELTEKDEMPVVDILDSRTHSFPIKDYKAVSVKRLTEIVDFINSLKGVIYIYCKGGHGRSGMVAAAVYGKRKNLSGSEALEHIGKEWNKQRDLSKVKPATVKRGSPQTRAQRKVVVDFLDN